jgi:hypothetical protein
MWTRFIFSVRLTAANATACFQTASSRNNDHHDSWCDLGIEGLSSRPSYISRDHLCSSSTHMSATFVCLSPEDSVRRGIRNDPTPCCATRCKWTNRDPRSGWLCLRSVIHRERNWGVPVVPIARPGSSPIRLRPHVRHVVIIRRVMPAFSRSPKVRGSVEDFPATSLILSLSQGTRAGGLLGSGLAWPVQRPKNSLVDG